MTAYNDTITETINNLDWVPQDWDEAVVDALTKADVLANLQNMNNSILDELTIADVILGVNAAMLFDGLSLDEVLTTRGDLTITVSELHTLAEILVSIKATPVVESIVTSSSLTVAIVDNIVEAITLSANLSSSANRSLTIVDTVTVSDNIQIALDALANSNLTTADTIQGIVKQFQSVIEAIELAGTISSQADMSITIAVAIAMSSTLNVANFLGLISEDLSIADSVVEIFNLSVALVDALSLADVTTNSVKLVALSTDDLQLLDSLSTASDFYNTIEDNLVFILTMDDGSTIYQGITMNPETYSITEYDNYAFNSTTNFNGTYLLAGTAGLYSMGGITDAGSYITAKIKTASLDFGSSSIKQCPKVYLGINSDASLILRVSVDGKYTASYQLDIDSDDLSTQIFDIGKGLKGRYWQFELQTKENSTLDLDEIELFPIQWGRKR